MTTESLNKRYWYYMVVQSQFTGGFRVTCGEVYADKPITSGKTVSELGHALLELANSGARHPSDNPVVMNYIFLREEDLTAPTTETEL